MSTPKATPSSIPSRFMNSATAAAASETASMRLGNLSSVVSRVTIKRHGRSQSHRVRILGCISETLKATRKTEGLTRSAIACQEACQKRNSHALWAAKCFSNYSLDLRRTPLRKVILTNENQAGATLKWPLPSPRRQIDIASSSTYRCVGERHLTDLKFFSQSGLRVDALMSAGARSFACTRGKSD